jgi:monoamine oxidase
VTDFDCIIVGAGAAGIAAARTLHDAGLRVAILEATDRIGGRVHTDYNFANIPIELGAEFIHGDGAITHDLVRQAGLHTVPVDRMNKMRWGRPSLPLSDLPEETRDIIEALHRDYVALKDADLPDDLSLAAYFEACGHDVVALRVADILYAQTCCARLDDLSCHDLQREMRVDTSGGEWGGEARIAEGYGALLTWYARDLDVRFMQPVTQIRRSPDGMIVHAGGKHKWIDYQTRTCLLTLPIAVFQRDKIKFDPPLSAEKWAAIRAFKMEAATKIILRYAHPFWDADLTYMANEWMAVRWWTPGHGREDADAVLTCYLTSDKAARVDDLSPTAAFKLGRMIIAQMLPDSTVPVTDARIVSWADAGYTRGGYAHLPPGSAWARERLAAPEDRVFFAGEATAYDSNPQTVHGAIQSGWRAAREIIAYHSGTNDATT